MPQRSNPSHGKGCRGTSLCQTRRNGLKGGAPNSSLARIEPQAHCTNKTMPVIEHPVYVGFLEHPGERHQHMQLHWRQGGCLVVPVRAEQVQLRKQGC